MAGRYLVLAFAGSGRHPNSAPLVARVCLAVRAWPDIFDDDRASFFAVLPKAAEACRMTEYTPGYRLIRLGAADARAEGRRWLFSCSLLHRVAPVRAWRRMVFLPFLNDEAAARQRAAFYRSNVAQSQALAKRRK